MDRDEISNLHRGPPIDASYQVSVHLAKQFSIDKHGHHRQFLFLIGRFLKIYSTNQKHELPVAAILSVTNTKELCNLGQYICKAAFHFREFFKISKLHFRESRVTVIGRLYRETDTYQYFMNINSFFKTVSVSRYNRNFNS
jgi:hypothetical protein